MRHATLICGVWLAATSVCFADAKPVEWNLSGRSPHLVAHYMPWFAVRKSAADSRLVWDHWKWDGKGVKRNPAVRLRDGSRQLAAAYQPLIGPYNSWSRVAVRYHLRTAQAAGIQAFLAIWYGPGSDTDKNIPLLLEEAQKCGMRVALCYEEKINFPGYRSPEGREEIMESAAKDLNYILKQYGSHPAYLERGGVPFVAQFNGWGTDELGPKYLTPSEWKKVFAKLSGKICYARQNLDEPYHPAIPGSYIWWTANAAQIDNYSKRAGELVATGKLNFFMTMICPGFDDSGVSGWNGTPRITPRKGLSVLKDTFVKALAGNPELIQIVTWNDFNEGTVVEPTRETGFQYLDAIETWWGEKTGRQVDLADNRQPFYEYARDASSREKAELPSRPFDKWVARRSLAVEVADYLSMLPQTH